LEFSTSLESSKKQSYLLASPLVEKKYEYQYKNAALLIVPQEKLIFINFSSDSNHEFSNYVEEYIEDIGYMSKKYEYLNFIGRPKKWAPDITHQVNIDELGNPESILSLFSKHALDKSKKRISELVSSLVIGSINDISKIGEDLPTSPLDMVKQKIILFDTDQTKFIYDSMDDQNVIRIQGLSGTGKTELLLHKLKELYTNERDSKILLTCHNKILSDKLRSRIPSFFNFMKVESQIDWENRLKCVHAWGSSAIPDSGAYRFICHHYQIPFETFSYRTTFDQVCKNAITNISSSFIQTQPFDYILIDESQDFPDSFFELCAQVTRKKLFIAGDIFQSIFDNPEKQISKADFLLNKCYRTDPKTLMFGHAFGMKLFEERKLRWLADSEWKACGYNIEKKPLDNSLEIVYTLSREPLRRFEDLPNDENLTGIFLEY
jgi:superfamily I DNA and RNA helicase